MNLVRVMGEENSMKLRFIGLGQMGQAMAGRLLEAGHDSTGRAVASRPWMA
jgi:3-hydroxyisobutyrate dehydrogenase-like beta-hydroxyacid dehydrogenase